jgi:transposase
MKSEKLELRKMIIKLHSKGKKQTDISNILDIPQTTVSFWIRRYVKSGELVDKPRSGKPAMLTPEQIENVKAYLLDYAPERYGGASIGWTTKMAIQFIKEKHGITFSMRRMQELFNIFGLSLITPRSEHYSASKLARNSFRDEFKKNFKMNIWIAPSLISMK